jgi:hypothetical protein
MRKEQEKCSICARRRPVIQYKYKDRVVRLCKSCDFIKKEQRIPA